MIVDAVVQLLHLLRMLPPDVVLQLVAVLPTEYTTAGVAFFGLFSEHPDFFGLQVGQVRAHHHALAILLVPLQVRFAVERLLAVCAREYRFRCPSLVVHLEQMSRKTPFRYQTGPGRRNTICSLKSIDFFENRKKHKKT